MADSGCLIIRLEKFIMLWNTLQLRRYFATIARILGVRSPVSAAKSDDHDNTIADAQKALALPLHSVVESPIKAPSGDPHDYITLSTYAWPNPNTPNGLPYILRDGQTNPEIQAYTDHKNLEHLIKSVRQLVSGYSVSHDERYAQRAIQLLDTWFLKPETRMNPNLNYAQIFPGKNNGLGNPSGIIETHQFVDLITSITKLEKSYHVPPHFKNGMRQWFSAYLQWLQTSTNGRNVAESVKNNQLTWYTAQKVAIAEFTGHATLAKDMLVYFMRNQLPSQINAEGGQPEELRRTKSFNYSLVNLRGLFRLAELGQNVGIDLWHYKLNNNASIEKALDFLVPYATGQQAWPYKQIHPYDPSLMKAVVKMAIKAYPEKRNVYESVLSHLKVF